MGSRCRGRPRTRWSATIDKFFDEMSEAFGEQLDWMSMAQDRDGWKQFEDAFVEFFKR